MIKYFADWITYNLLSLSPKGLLAEAVNFFTYETVKIFFLLMVIIFVVSFIRSFLPPEKIRKILSAKRKHYGNALAALLGIITPFCSCSAIPLFLGFVEAGVPLGVTFSFLVSSPMINEVALVMLLGLFGWRIALIYTLSGLGIAIISGIVIGRLKVESLVEDFVYKSKAGKAADPLKMSLAERVNYATTYTFDIIKQIWPHVVIGIGIGAWIHGYVPTDFLARYAGRSTWYAVPLATLLGIPLYSNAAGIIPLISVLTEKGVSMGTSLAFMMAVVGLSLPAFMILRKVMKVKLLVIFASIVGIGIMFTGYLFNLIL
ncbi:MAG: permease [bacterium]